MAPGICAVLALTAWLVLTPAPASACEPGVAAAADAAFRETLALWKNERYEALFARGYLEHQVALSQEDFVRLMRREDRVLQCCWLMVRDVSVACDAGAAYVTARIGYEVAGFLFDGRAWSQDTAPKEVWETWRLLWQAGAYRVDLYQVLGPSYLYYEKQPGIVRRFDFPRFPRIEPRAPKR
jgi:hypothetical protein